MSTRLRKFIKKITQMNYFYLKLLGEGLEEGEANGNRGRPICEAVNSEAIKRVATPQLP